MRVLSRTVPFSVPSQNRIGSHIVKPRGYLRRSAVASAAARKMGLNAPIYCEQRRDSPVKRWMREAGFDKAQVRLTLRVLPKETP